MSDFERDFERAPTAPGLGGLTPSEWTMLALVEEYGPISVTDAIAKRMESGTTEKQVRKRVRLPLFRLLSWEMIDLASDRVYITDQGVMYLDAQSESDFDRS